MCVTRPPCSHTSNFSQKSRKITQGLLEKKKNSECDSVVLLEQKEGMESI